MDLVLRRTRTAETGNVFRAENKSDRAFRGGGAAEAVLSTDLRSFIIMQKVFISNERHLYRTQLREL